MIKENKFMLLVALTLLPALSTFSTDIYLPSLPAMTNYFHTTPKLMQMTLSSYIFGFAISMLLSGVLSDRFGRRKVLISGISLHLVATILCLLTKNIYLFILFRFIQALGGCCGTVIARVLVRELYDSKSVVKVMSILAGAMSLSPIIAPILGGVLQRFFSWHANFFVLLFFSSTVMCTTLLFIRDSPKTVLRSLAIKEVFSIYKKTMRNSIFILFTLAIGFAWAGFSAFITGSPFLFIKKMHFSPSSFGVLYAIIVLSYMGGATISSKLSRVYTPLQATFIGILFCVVASSMLYFVTFSIGLSVSTTVIFISLFLAGCGIIIPNCQVGSLLPFTENLGVVSSLFYCIEMLFGTVSSSTIAHLYIVTTYPIISILFASSVLSLLCFYLNFSGRNSFVTISK